MLPNKCLQICLVFLFFFICKFLFPRILFFFCQNPFLLFFFYTMIVIDKTQMLPFFCKLNKSSAPKQGKYLSNFFHPPNNWVTIGQYSSWSVFWLMVLSCVHLLGHTGPMPSLENKTITEKKFQFALMLAADIKYNFMYFCLFPVICCPCLQLFCSNSKRSHIALIGGLCWKNSQPIGALES